MTLFVRRTIEIELDGPVEIVNEVAAKIAAVDFGGGLTRSRVAQHLDILDDSGAVVTAEVAAWCRQERKS